MNLNPSQLKAVNLDAPIIVCMSGPGSGKTRTGVARTARLIKAGRRVLVLTFTNSAAHEFRSRIMAELQAAIGIHSVSDSVAHNTDFLTLHAYCFRLIRRFGHLIGYEKGTTALLSEHDADEVLEEVRDELGCKFSLNAIKANKTEEPLAQQVWTEYRFRLKQNNVVDYDRILFDAYLLLTIDEVRQAIAVDDLIVDEAQDSAAIDWQIYQAIPAASKFFIGDIDQAIFEFRRAHPEGLLELVAEANLLGPACGHKVLRLEENYRCAEAICDAANQLIAHNKLRYDKQTVSATGACGIVSVAGFPDPWSELENLAKNIALYHFMGKTIAVLCRTNYAVKQVRDYLSTRLPVYAGANQSRFALPADWTRAMLLLGLMISPYNEILAERLLQLDVPKAIVSRWKTEAKATGAYLSDRLKLQVVAFGPDSSFEADNPDLLLRFLAMNLVSEGTVGLIQQRAQLLPADASIADLLQDLQSNERPQSHQPENTIYTGTIHSAKGREFDCVFLPGFEETKMADENIEEERRLAFVAITRARTAVHISFSEKRKPRWGAVELCQPSRFIAECGL